MGDYITTQNLKITNYKPFANRKAQEGDVNITNDENGNFELNSERHKKLIDKLQTLDKDSSSLSLDDLKLSKNLIGQMDIKNVTLNNNVANFVFKDELILRVDMSINSKTAIKSLQKEIANGNADYNDGIINFMLQCITPRTPLKGAEIVINNLPDGIETLGDVKAYYNLPDGCLRNNIAQGGGDFDAYKAETPLYIHVGTLANGLGVSEEQIEALFNLK